MPRVLRRGLKVLHVFRDQYKGDDDSVKDFWRGCCGSSCLMTLGIFELSVQCVSYGKSTCCIVGALRVLGPRG